VTGDCVSARVQPTIDCPFVGCGHPFQHVTLNDWQEDLDQCPHTCGCLDIEGGVFGVFRFDRSHDISKNPSPEDCQRHLVDEMAHPRCDEKCNVQKFLAESEYDRLAADAEVFEAERCADLPKTREC
jgi:hypothetical protein